MTYPVQHEFEVFLAETIGLQLASLRHHLSLCSSNEGRDQHPPTKEQIAQICKFIEVISREAQRLHEKIRQDDAPGDFDLTSRNVISTAEPTQSGPGCGPGIRSALECLASH